MAKTVYIPDADHPFVCEINNVKYEYEQGTWQEVPDEVAELIENNGEQTPKPNDYREAPAGSVWTYGEDGKAVWGEPASGLPDTGSASAGDALVLDNSKKAVWETPTPELPSADSASAGDVLALNSSKEPTWATQDGMSVKAIINIKPSANAETATIYIKDKSGVNSYAIWELAHDVDQSGNVDVLFVKNAETGTPSGWVDKQRTGVIGRIRLKRDGNTDYYYIYIPELTLWGVGSSSQLVKLPAIETRQRSAISSFECDISKKETAPSAANASAGQILTLDGQKNPVWANPGGGDKIEYEFSYTRVYGVRYSVEVKFTLNGSTSPASMVELWNAAVGDDSVRTLTAYPKSTADSNYTPFRVRIKKQSGSVTKYYIYIEGFAFIDENTPGSAYRHIGVFFQDNALAGQPLPGGQELTTNPFSVVAKVIPIKEDLILYVYPVEDGNGDKRLYFYKDDNGGSELEMLEFKSYIDDTASINLQFIIGSLQTTDTFANWEALHSHSRITGNISKNAYSNHGIDDYYTFVYDGINCDLSNVADNANYVDVTAQT